jgi:hypothetical protein
MGSRMSIKIVVAFLVFGGLALIIYSSMGLQQVTGEVCITHNGSTECRVASGTTQEEVLRTAADMACSALASGMTDRISCQNSVPTRVTWQN